MNVCLRECLSRTGECGWNKSLRQVGIRQQPLKPPLRMYGSSQPFANLVSTAIAVQ